MPVLLATSVSMLEDPCLSCFQALTKNRLPMPKTTGVANSPMMIRAYSQSFRNMLMTMMAMESTKAQIVLRFKDW